MRPDPNTALRQRLGRYPAVLMEGAVIERIRRETTLPLDPNLLNAGLIYSRPGRLAMERVYSQYIRAAAEHRLPILVAAPTWRANPERVRKAAIGGVDKVNRDAVRFMRSFCPVSTHGAPPVLLGGLMACRGDAYTPQEALETAAAEDFHMPQAACLAAAGVDYIMAATLPALSEAVGLARALASQSAPYIISFIIRRDGAVLDGTPLSTAIERIDGQVAPPPDFYMVNCVHPETVKAGLGEQLLTNATLKSRLLGIQANTSEKSPEELDGSETLDGAAPQAFAEQMLALYKGSGLRVLGGCCGTDHRHIAAIADGLAKQQSVQNG